MTTNAYSPPKAVVELAISLSSVRRLTWSMLGVSGIVLIGGLTWLGVLYLASLVELPGAFSSFVKSISEAQDISTVKSACLSLARLEEVDLSSRRSWILWAPTLAFSLAVAIGALATWSLRILTRIENQLQQTQT